YRHRPQAGSASDRRERLARRPRAGSDPRHDRIADRSPRVARPPGRGPGPGPEPGRLMSLLAPGSVAPDFTATASDGQTYNLRRLLQESRVLLVFYPGNNTPG